jgi:hypothetical protein
VSHRLQRPAAGRGPHSVPHAGGAPPRGRRRRGASSALLLATLLTASLAVGCGGTDGDDGSGNVVGDRDGRRAVAPETSTSPTTTDPRPTRNAPAERPFRWTRLDRRTGLRVAVRQRTGGGASENRGTLTITVTRRTPEQVRRDLGAARSLAIGCQRRSGGNDLAHQRVTPGGPVAVGTTYTSNEVSVRGRRTFREDLDFCQLFIGGPTGTVNEPYLTVEYEPSGADADR